MFYTFITALIMTVVKLKVFVLNLVGFYSRVERGKEKLLTSHFPFYTFNALLMNETFKRARERDCKTVMMTLNTFYL